MTDSVQIALIVAVAPTLTGIAALIIALKNLRKTADLTVHINSRMDDLLKARAAQGHSEGKAEGIAEERSK